MKVSEIMIKKVVTAEEDEKVSKVLVKMESNHIHQIPIVMKGKYDGMIILKDLLTGRFEPQSTEIKKFKVSTPTLNPDDNLEDAAVKVIDSGYRTLPVVSKDFLQGIVSLTDLVKYLKYSGEELADHFMCDVTTVKENDNLGKILHLMDEKRVSRLPVVNFEGKVIGCFDEFGMIKFLISPHESIRFSEITEVKKESLKGFKVKDFMRPSTTIEVDDFSIKKVIEKLQSNEEVILTKKDLPVGVIMPKDLMEHAITEETLPLYVPHYKELDPSLRGQFETMVDNFLNKFSKSFTIERFVIYVDKFKTEGKGKYSLKARLIANHRLFPAQAVSFDAIEAVHMLLDKLERELVKHHDVDLSRRPGQRIKIDSEECFGCSTCASLYPDLFEVGEDGKVRIKDDVIKDKEKLKRVIKSCPVQAIRLLENKNNKKSK